MQNARIFVASSLSEVVKQLVFFRLTGMLIIRRAAGFRQDEVSMVVEDGQPLRIRWGAYEGDANESILHQLNAWGEIHFMFHTSGPLRLLPQPAQAPHQEQSRLHIAPESNIPSLAVKAKDYPIMKVPRYDRTVFLLINGSRTISDLTHLTRRSLPAVYASLSRLRDQQLIEVSL